MTDEQKAAYIIAQAACMNAQIAAMRADNQADIIVHKPPRHNGAAFLKLIDESPLHHNAVLTLFGS